MTQTNCSLDSFVDDNDTIEIENAAQKIRDKIVVREGTVEDVKDIKKLRDYAQQVSSFNSQKEIEELIEACLKKRKLI